MPSVATNGLSRSSSITNEKNNSHASGDKVNRPDRFDHSDGTPFDDAPAINPLPYLRGVVGAAVGGAAGYVLFFWLTRQGFYAMVVPGALIGFGCAMASQIRSVGLALFCAVTAAALGIFIEWRFRPLLEDDSFGFFLQHLERLQTMTLIMIAVGGLVAGWIGLGRQKSV